MGFHEVLFVAVITWNVLLGQAVSNCLNFNSFDNNKYDGCFEFFNASMSSEALELTRDTSNPDPQYSMTRISGRALLRQSYRVWKQSSVASFNTTFVFNIKIKNGLGGEGLAFVISSNLEKPGKSHGQWLGLFNSSINGKSSCKLVAVEFDTRKSAGTNDPDDNHVGINVHNINSEKIKSLSTEEINLKGGYDIRAWIQYDGKERRLRIYIGNSSGSEFQFRPSEPILSCALDLSTYVEQNVYFGFSASTGIDTELHCVKSWTLDITPLTSRKNRVLIIALSTAAAAAFLVVAAAVVVRFVKYSKAQAEAKLTSVAIDNLPGQPREFKYKLLKKATSNFSPKSEIGRGGFGAVYKAILPGEKTVVAVKQMLKDSKRGKEEFVSEIRIIKRLRHRNLVPLLGWCHDKGHLMMVYEYMPNGSLEKHIYRGLLDWKERYKIVSGVASALLYLHAECEQQVIHRDVKASNIMLDSDYNARLGDFGLARLIEHDRTSYTTNGIAGTVGYIAPECFNSGRATVESDVFSFGAVALEVACGRPVVFGGDAPDLVNWVWKLYRENRLMEAADCRLVMPSKEGDVNENDVTRLMMVGLACSNPNAGDRPTMWQVKQILSKDMSPPFVPAFRPPFVWSHPFGDSTSTTTITTENGSSSMNSLPPLSEEAETGILQHRRNGSR